MIPLLAILFAGVIAPQDYYVAASGNDSNAGTNGAPWATIAKVNATATAGHTVRFNGGDRFEGALTLKTGTNYTSYGSGQATISGGVLVTTWTLVDSPHNVWRATWNAGRPRELFVNGVRVKRARTSTPLPSGTTQNSSGYDTSGSSSPGYLSTYANKADIEFVFLIGWQNGYCPVSTVSGNTITMLAAPFAEFIFDRGWLSLPVTPLCVENAYEIFSANNTAGTYYQDRTNGFVYLIPPSGGDPNTMQVIAPTLQQIATATSVSNIVVSNLIFEHTTNTDINTAGFSDVQACVTGSDLPNIIGLRALKAAVDVEMSSNVTIVRCIVRRLGNSGIQIGTSCTDCKIAGTIVYDTSGNGIQVGGPTQYAGLQPMRTSINNNVMALVGQEYQGACALMQWWAVDSNITHNEAYHLPYTGLSVGLGWGREPNPNGNLRNSATYNDIHDYMKVMDDGGGIYFNSREPSAVASFNYIHDAGGTITLTAGMYADDASFGNTMANNVCVQYGSLTFQINNNISNNGFFLNTADGGAYHVQNGAAFVAANTYDTLNVVSTTAGRAAGTALGAGLTSAYSDVYTLAHTLVP